MNEATSPAIQNESAPEQPRVERAVASWTKTAIIGVEEVNLQTLTRLAQTLFESHLVPSSVTSWQAAFAVILQGQEVGLPPSFSINNIYVVHGRPKLGGRAVFALVTRDYGHDALIIEERTDDHCTVSYAKPGWQARKRFTYTVEMAAKAGLLVKKADGSYTAPPQAKGVPTWDAYRAEMLQWKAVSRVGDIAFPECLGGIAVDDSTPEVDIEAKVNPTAEELESEYVTRNRNRFWEVVGDTGLSNDATRAGFLRRMSRTGTEHLTEFIENEHPEIVAEMIADAEALATYERQKRDEEARLARKMEEKRAADQRGRERALASTGVSINEFVTHAGDPLPEDGDGE